MAEVRAVYSAAKHPDVLLGKRTEDEVLYSFLDTFQAHSVHAKDSTVTLDEWLEYYNNVSCSIDNDDYFELMMCNAYGLK